jgi:hypothetical protein
VTFPSALARRGQSSTRPEPATHDRGRLPARQLDALVRAAVATLDAFRGAAR